MIDNLNNNQSSNYQLCLNEKTEINNDTSSNVCDISCIENVDEQQIDCVTGTLRFWGFVLLMSLGTIGFNVANCVSDATCFDMLGSCINNNNNIKDRKQNH